MEFTLNNYVITIEQNGFIVNQAEMIEYLNCINWNAENGDDVLYYSSSNAYDSLSDSFDLEITLQYGNDIYLVAVDEAKHAYDLI